MDPFEVRLNLITNLQRLTSSQNSINATVRFLTKHGPRCGGDLWECLVEECEKASINARINILYLLDSLLLTSINGHAVQPGSFDYAAAIERDLPRLVDAVVPPSRDGMLNLLSVRQMLASWKMKRVVDPALIERLSDFLVGREKELEQAAVAAQTSTVDSVKSSRKDVLERINDDRERHKRLRERMWVLPVPALRSLTTRSNSATTILATTHRLATFAPSGLSDAPSASSGAPGEFLATDGTAQTAQASLGSELALDVEFEQLWAANEAEAPVILVAG